MKNTGGNFNKVNEQLSNTVDRIARQLSSLLKPGKDGDHIEYKYEVIDLICGDKDELLEYGQEKVEFNDKQLETLLASGTQSLRDFFHSTSQHEDNREKVIASTLCHAFRDGIGQNIIALHHHTTAPQLPYDMLNNLKLTLEDNLRNFEILFGKQSDELSYIFKKVETSVLVDIETAMTIYENNYELEAPMDIRHKTQHLINPLPENFHSIK